MAKYMENGGDRLTTEMEVIQSVRQVDTYLSLQKKFQAHQCNVAKSKSNDGSGNTNGNVKAKGKGKSNAKSDAKPNPCKVYEDAHEWKDCLNNKYGCKFKGEKKDNQAKTGDKKKCNNKDLHAPIVTFADDKSVTSADFNFNSDSEEAMMLLEPDESLHPETVLSIPRSDDEAVRAVTTVLLDQGFSGHVIVSYDFAAQLGGYDPVTHEGKGSTYRTVVVM